MILFNIWTPTQEIHFETLDFKARIPKNWKYHDLGHVDDLDSTTKKIENERKNLQPQKILERIVFEEEKLEAELGRAILVKDPSNKKNTLWVYYKRDLEEQLDIFNRAYRESQAVLHLGLRKKLEDYWGLPNLEVYNEKTFCIKAGLNALLHRGIIGDPRLISHYFGD